MNTTTENKNPLVTIVMPVYNGESFILRCLDSIKRQTYTNYEIIIINDGSTDNTDKIINEIKDEHIKYISQQNEGLSSARQKGIELSSGKFFCTIDVDDYYEDTFLETMVSYALKNNSDICVCERYDIRKNNKKLIELKVQNTQVLNDNDFLSLAKTAECGDSWNKLYKLSFIKNNKIKFSLPRGFNGNDYLFNHLCLLFHPKITAIKVPLLNHTKEKGSMVRSFKPRIIDGYFYICSTLKEEMNKSNYPNNESIISKLYWNLVLNAYNNTARYCPLNQLKKYIKVFLEKSNYYATELLVDKPYSIKKFDRKIFKSIINYNVNKLIFYALYIKLHR